MTSTREDQSGYLFGKVFYGWVIVFAAWLIMFFSVGVQMGSFPVFFGELLDEFGWSRGSLALGFTLNTLFLAVFGPIAGFMTNRVGPKRTVIVGALIGSIGIVLVSLTTEQWHFYVTYGLLLPLGISLAFYIPTVTTVRRWFSRKAALAVSLAMTGSSAGLMVGPHAARALIDSYGWQTTYQVFAVILAVGVVACALLLKRSPESIGTHPDGIPIDEAAAEKRDDFAARTETWSPREAFRTRTLWLYMVAQAAFMVPVIAMLAHLVEWADTDLGLGERYAEGMVSLLAGMALLGRIVGGIASDALMNRFGRKPVLYFCILGVTVSAFFALAVDSRLTMALFVAVLGLSYGSSVGIFPTYLGDLYGVISMPLLLGFVGLGEASLGAIGPWLFGMIYDSTGNYDLGFKIGAVLGAASLISLFFIKQPVKRKEGSL